MKRRSSLFLSLTLGTVVLAATSCLAPVQAQNAVPTKAQRLASLDRAIAGAKKGAVRIGDILYPVAQIRNHRRSVANESSNSLTLKSSFAPVNKWPGGRVPYVFDPGLAANYRANFLNAARQWEAAANVKFFERTNEEDYVRVFTDPGGGSYSFLGAVGGEQDMSLAFGDEIVAAHEIAHALGVIHEHSRSDRDEFVIIRFDNIQTAEYNQYEKIDSSLNVGPYDFESCMHYPSLGVGFAIDPTKETIEARLKFTQFQKLFGQRERISELDKRGMAMVYGAPIDPNPTPTPAPTATPRPTARPRPTSTPRPPVEIPRPDNDDFVDARPIEGESGTENGDNLGATAQAGEPEHAGASPTRSVWFRWTAPSSGNYAFGTEESRFDTVLSAYTGTELTTLQRIADDDDSGPTTRSLMQFAATSGTTYIIALDGFGVGRGEYELAWRKLSDSDPSPTPTPGPTVRPGKPVPTPIVTVPSVIVSDVIVTEGHEGNPQVAFAITMTKPVTSNVEVSYRTDGGTATPGSDFSPGSGTVSFGPDDSTRFVSIDILPDTIREKTETFSLIISSADAPVLDREGRCTINDDDSKTKSRDAEVVPTTPNRPRPSGGTS